MSSAVKIFRRTIAKPNALTRTNSYAHARSGPSLPPACANCCKSSRSPRRALVVQTSHQVDGELRRSRANPRAPVWLAREDGPARRAAADASRRLRVRDSGAPTRAGRRRHLHRRHSPQRSHARRPCRRAHRAHQGRRPSRGTHHPDSRAREPADRGPLRPRGRRDGYSSCRSTGVC